MSDPRPRREIADPPQMSLAEKLTCEWEARHDVVARGRIADVAPVQHYLTHARCEDNRHPRREAHPAPEPAPAHRDSVPAGLRGWLRWGEDRLDSSGSVLPRGC